MNNQNKKGRIFVISGPSGVGKGTLLAILLKKHPEISVSVSVTTRNPRFGETDGIDYNFIYREKFEQLIKEDQLIEWAEFAGNYYGTYIKTVEDALDKGKDLALEIEVQGALQIKKKIKDAVLIFIMPPSIEELKNRLVNRNTESEEVIERRLSIFDREITKKNEFNYEVVNNSIEQAVKDLEDIIIKEKSRA